MMRSTTITMALTLAMSASLTLAQPTDAVDDAPQRGEGPVLLSQLDPPADGEAPRRDFKPPRDRERDVDGDRPRPGQRDRRPKPLTDQQKEQVLGVLADINPEMKQRFDKAVENNPRRANLMLAHMYHGRMQDLIKLRKDDPDFYKVRVDEHRQRLVTLKLVRALREANEAGDDAKAAKIKAKLREQLEATFETRQKVRERELKMLEQRIAKLREELKDHRQRKGELIDDAFKKMVSGEGQPDEDRRERGPRKGPRDRDE
jgi:hypothetical protein